MSPGASLRSLQLLPLTLQTHRPSRPSCSFPLPVQRVGPPVLPARPAPASPSIPIHVHPHCPRDSAQTFRGCTMSKKYAMPPAGLRVTHSRAYWYCFRPVSDFGTLTLFLDRYSVPPPRAADIVRHALATHYLPSLCDRRHIALKRRRPLTRRDTINHMHRSQILHITWRGRG